MADCLWLISIELLEGSSERTSVRRWASTVSGDEGASRPHPTGPRDGTVQHVELGVFRGAVACRWSINHVHAAPLRWALRLILGAR